MVTLTRKRGTVRVLRLRPGRVAGHLRMTISHYLNNSQEDIYDREIHLELAELRYEQALEAAERQGYGIVERRD